jgi:hypothetical protein
VVWGGIHDSDRQGDEGMSKGEGAGYIYFMAHTGLTKIGYSSYPYGRLIEFSPRNPGIVLTHEIETNAMRHLERLLHWQLRGYHAQDVDHKGEEWFRLPAIEMARLRGIKRVDVGHPWRRAENRGVHRVDVGET